MNPNLSRTLTAQANEKVGETIKLQGWVDTLRDHGRVTFVDLRDKLGIIQCVITKKGDKLSDESVIEIIGKVNKRPENSVNKDLVTGTIEIDVSEYKVLNKCKELPIPVKSDGYEIDEELRLKYRYLDLRRERMHNILVMRSNFVRSLREGFFEQDFTEVETPLLSMGTSEGARNFLVPSRMAPGKFYALPQSPQQYKQLLMTAGVDRYFQLARCIRDEDLKFDRGFEFTQLDLEMSFVNESEVMSAVENSVKAAVKAVGSKLKEDPFPVIPYDEAIKKYGADKFDLRTEEEKKANVLAFAWVVKFPFFKKVDRKDASEVEESRSGWVFTHNPFSKPVDEHIEWHLKGENIDKIMTTQYDLVCNGLEVGGGSIRAHDPEVLKATYKIMGYSEEDMMKAIGHMVKAFELGTPPHGGLALGVDRIIMLLANEQSLKETIAFPMTRRGRTSVMDAPSIANPDHLKELGLAVNIGEESDVIFVRLKRLLDSEDVKYEVIEHRSVKTSEEAAEVRNTPMDIAPKAMILTKPDGGLVMVCIPADKKLDMKKASAVVGEKLKFADPEFVESELGVKVGAVPPFGKLFEIETYIDKSFWEKEKVAFNAGRRDRSIIMKASDLIKIAEPNPVSKDSDFKQ
ncbi:aspartate--tRNA ligase [Candidatus Dojkabacteria bacterium]|nr:aspartate--tRNA ligase [Candidatus Dojkabacteria bacterium]